MGYVTLDEDLLFWGRATNMQTHAYNYSLSKVISGKGRNKFVTNQIPIPSFVLLVLVFFAYYIA
jgi:hypothetical protein